MKNTHRTVLTPLLLSGALLLSPLASAELDMGGGANTIQAKFDAFSACNNKAKAQGLGDEACDKEAKELRSMLGSSNSTASTSPGNGSAQARSHNASMKKTVKK